MRRSFLVLLLMPLAGVATFVCGTIWGAVMVGSAPGDFSTTLATEAGVHTWIAFSLMTLGAASFLTAPLVASWFWLRERRLRAATPNQSDGRQPPVSRP